MSKNDFSHLDFSHLPIIDKLRKIWDRITSGQSIFEIEQHIRDDANNFYTYYSPASNNRNAEERNFNLIHKIKTIFIIFINKLTPARRLIYFITLFLFLFGLIKANLGYTTFGFFLLNLMLAFELADKLLAKDELAMARDIQTSMLPEEPPHIQSADVAVLYMTANEVGGDIYDFISTGREEHPIFLIGDIAGHGMSAALHMVQMQTLLRTEPFEGDLKDYIVRLNRKLHALLPNTKFVSANFLWINSNSIWQYARCGHSPLLHYHADQKVCQSIISVGVGLGMINSGFSDNLEIMQIKPKTGDLLVLYTDGLVEITNEKGDAFGEERLQQCIRENASTPVEGIKNNILTTLKEFIHKGKMTDDISLLIIRVK